MRSTETSEIEVEISVVVILRRGARVRHVRHRGLQRPPALAGFSVIVFGREEVAAHPLGGLVEVAEAVAAEAGGPEQLRGVEAPGEVEVRHALRRRVHVGGLVGAGVGLVGGIEV